jgi:hypothetical protein
MIFKIKDSRILFLKVLNIRTFLSCLFVAFFHVVAAQNYNMYLNRELNNRYEGILYNSDFHTAIKPFQWQDLQLIDKTDSLTKTLNYNGSKAFLDVLRNSSWVEYVGPKVNFSLNPYLGLNQGFNTLSSDFFAGRELGAMANVQIGSNFCVNATAMWGKSDFVDYLNLMTDKSGVITGNGQAMASGGGYKYKNLIGYISYTAGKYFNFQLGNDRNFIGDGYRSLLLSDNAKNYPFLKFTTTLWKLKYVNLFTNFQDLSLNRENKWIKTNKFSAMHYLSWNVNKRLQLGFFESIVFQNRDTTKKFAYDVNYLNPLVFYRPVEYAMGSADNALMGINYKVKIASNMQCYGQVVIDEFLLSAIKSDVKKLLKLPVIESSTGWWANKYGFQFGYKWFDLLKIKNLQFQAEYNYVRPYTYSHGSVLQNYAHFNQALAHPLGANFMEGLLFLRYYLNNVLFEFRYSNAVYGEDVKESNYGKDIFKSYIKRPGDYGNYTGQGLKTNLTYYDFKINYLINAKTNLCAEIGFNKRYLTNADQTSKTDYVYVGIRTAISNAYFDK